MDFEYKYVWRIFLIFLFWILPLTSVISERPSPETLPCLIFCHEWNSPLLLSKKRGMFPAAWREGGFWDGAVRDTGLSLKLPFNKSYFWHPLSLVISRVTWSLPSPETLWDFVGKLVFLSFWSVAGLAVNSQKLPKSGSHPSFCFLGF